VLPGLPASFFCKLRFALSQEGRSGRGLDRLSPASTLLAENCLGREVSLDALNSKLGFGQRRTR